ncbi:hypothetical protein AB9K41_09980 [Cribrihabitans sp. XS_ASV171]
MALQDPGITETLLARRGCAVWWLHRIGPASVVHEGGHFQTPMRGQFSVPIDRRRKNLTLDQVAAAAGMSSGHLSRVGHYQHEIESIAEKSEVPIIVLDDSRSG